VGLDAVRATARELGGDVAVETQAGRGARWTIHLPREAAQGRRPA
jgi:chemosensory pili system protein ChpA (sensor histidine kinase/response regulator)